MNRRVKHDGVDWLRVVVYTLAVEIVAVAAALVIAWCMGWIV